MKTVREKIKKIFTAKKEEPKLEASQNEVQATLNRAPKKTSLYYFNKSSLLSNVLLLSVPLDFLITTSISKEAAQNISEITFATAIFCLLLSLTDIWKSPILNTLSLIKDKREKFLGFEKNYYWISVIVLSLFFTIGFLSKFKFESFSPELVAQLLFGLVIATVSAISVLKQIRAIREKQHTLAYDLATQVEQANFVNFVLVVIELAAARLFAPLLSITVLAFAEYSVTAIAIGSLFTTLLLLSSQIPKLESFQAPCKFCKKMTSKVALDGVCLQCYSTRRN